MAWTKAQSNTENGNAPATLAFSSNVVAGNLLLVEIGGNNTGLSVSDDTGHNTWHQIVEQADGLNDQVTALWYTIATQSEALSVVPGGSFSTSSFVNMIIQEWAHTGGGTISLDQSAGNAPASTANPVSPSITPTAADALVLASSYSNSAQITVGGEVDAPFTFEDKAWDGAPGGASDTACIASYQQSTPASVSATFHYSGSGATSQIIASFIAGTPPPEKQTSYYTRRRMIARR